MPGIDGNPNIAEAGRATRFLKSTKRPKGRKKPSALEKYLEEIEERKEKLRHYAMEHMLQIICQ